MTMGQVTLSGQAPTVGFPVMSNTQIEQADTNALYEPGMVIAVRNNGNWSWAEYVQLDNNGCSQGEVLVTNFATFKQYSVRQAVVADDGYQDTMRGISAATIASQRFGWMYIGGYVEKADCSKTVASADGLTISASTAGKLTPVRASSVLNATTGTVVNGTVPVGRIGIGRSAFATGVGSITILGMWG